MCSALLEIMEPEIREREKKSAIVSGIEILRECGHSEEEIKIRIMKKYELSEEEMNKYLV